MKKSQLPKIQNVIKSPTYMSLRNFCVAIDTNVIVSKFTVIKKTNKIKCCNVGTIAALYNSMNTHTKEKAMKKLYEISSGTSSLGLYFGENEKEAIEEMRVLSGSDPDADFSALDVEDLGGEWIYNNYYYVYDDCGDLYVNCVDTDGQPHTDYSPSPMVLDALGLDWREDGSLYRV